MAFITIEKEDILDCIDNCVFIYIDEISEIKRVNVKETDIFYYNDSVLRTKLRLTDVCRMITNAENNELENKPK